MNSLKASYQLIKHQKINYLIITVTALLFFLTPLGLALVIREIFNRLEGLSDYSLSMWTLIMLIPLLYIVQIITDVFFAIAVWRFSLSCQIILRKNMLEGIYKQPGASPLTDSPGEAVSRFRGDVQEVVWFSALTSDILSFGVFAVIAFYLMYQINSFVTFVVFIPFVIIVGIINFSRGKLTLYRKAARKAAGKVTGNIGEVYGSIQAIKVASADNNVLENFRVINEERRVTAIKDNAFAAVIRSSGALVVSIGIGIMLLLVGRSMQAGDFTIGDFSLFVFLMNWLTGFVRYLGEFLAWYTRTKVSYDRMSKLMQGENGSIPEENLVKSVPLYVKEQYPGTPALNKQKYDRLELLEIKDLSFTYKDSSNGIHDINFQVPKGSFTVITGRIGSGKTTLLRSLLGLLPRDKGDIFWNNQIVNDPATFFVPPRAAYTGQVPRLFSETVKENLLLGLPASSVNIDEALALAVIEDDVNSFDQKLETKIGPKGVKLSGGQIHRVAAARMFIREPELVIFDDISSALDVETEKVLWKRVFTNAHGTYLITSHRKSALKQADNIVLLKNGRIEALGKLDDLLSRSEEMQKLWFEELEGTESETGFEVKEQILQKIPARSITTNITSKKIPLGGGKNAELALLQMFENQIPSYWKIQELSKKEWGELIKLVLKDQVVTNDEYHLLVNILDNFQLYGSTLDAALEDNVIDDNERNELIKTREKLIIDATNIANHDKIISSDEQEILDRLLFIVQELRALETED
ncbi:MAG: ABC transporter ATP-binding protein [Candidatus Kariarchaeaceae archaeon]|jgi:ATP-binding cassette subfamily B protein